MRCRRCNYRLWNLPSRKCPECGLAFLPSGYEFLANAVRFCCPGCHTAYYGTDEKGHLSPRAFHCVTCGGDIDMDQMILLPTEGVDEDITGVDALPWRERGRIGLLRAWLRTVGQGMSAPGRLMRKVPATATAPLPWGFYLLTLAVGLLVGVSPLFLFALVGGAVVDVLIAATIIAGVVFIGATAYAAIWAGITHGLLRLFGRPPHPIRRTTSAILHSSGPMVLTAVPCFSPYMVPVACLWWTVSAIIAVHAAQGVSGLRATIAVGAWPLLVGVATFAGLFSLMFWSTSTAFTATGSLMSNTSNAQAVLDSLIVWADEHHGVEPDHAVLLLEDTALTSTVLVTPDSGSDDTTMRVGSTRIDRLDAMTPLERKAVIDAAIEALPDGLVAHRLGDFVFTYHGINLDDDDGKLWLLVLTADPDTAAPGLQSMVWVGYVDGTVQPIPLQQFPQHLQIQNTLRGGHGLPPLPDPLTITHGQPARAGR